MLAIKVSDSSPLASVVPVIMVVPLLEELTGAVAGAATVTPLTALPYWSVTLITSGWAKSLVTAAFFAAAGDQVMLAAAPA